jgi:hypothetical protein
MNSARASVNLANGESLMDETVTKKTRESVVGPQTLVYLFYLPSHMHALAFPVLARLLVVMATELIEPPRASFELDRICRSEDNTASLANGIRCRSPFGLDGL